MTAPIDIWNWEREPQPPSARVVVCRPGLYSRPVGIEAADPRTRMLAHVVRGGTMILPFEAHLMPSFKLRRGIIPALYAERQADLTGVGALLAVQAERRALVLCPREAIDLSHALWVATGTLPRTGAHYPANGYAYPKTEPKQCGRLVCGKWQCAKTDMHLGACIAEPTVFDNRRPSVGLVVIIPPPDVRTCVACGGDGFAMEPYEGPVPHRLCNGSGRIGPWPLHPTWIRGLVEQCRVAGVPVAFLGWGEWEPKEDGAQVMDLPDWIT